MLRKIRVTPLAAESFGVRSMCTYVETPDVRVLLDAGVSLCPLRFGLPPHPLEFRAIASARRRIAEAAEKAEIVTLSHYHFDHHTPSYEDWLCNWTAETETARQIYEEKTVLMKNPREDINFSQRRRGWIFQKTGGKFAAELEVADGRTFHFGKSTTIRFSKPVFHGPEDSALGWVLMTTIEREGEKFMFAPDVQGPMTRDTLHMIEMEKPHLLMIGGPPLYLAGFKVDDGQVQAGLKGLERVVEVAETVILEHHVLRDEGWREKIEGVFWKARETGCKILTAAEFLSMDNAFLEATRRRLYAENPPSSEFEKWMNKKLAEKKRVKPPI
ncbi:MAG: MBL fold metallo-hydrolase [Candidatus Bathyarchaeales archaeon]